MHKNRHLLLHQIKRELVPKEKKLQEKIQIMIFRIRKMIISIVLIVVTIMTIVIIIATRRMLIPMKKNKRNKILRNQKKPKQGPKR